MNLAMWLRRRATELWLPLALLAAWYFASRNSEALFFPPMTDVLTRFVGDFVQLDGLKANLLPSVLRMAAGFALAVVLGVGVGYLVGLTRVGRLMLMPVFDVFRSTPVIALIPVFIALFGLGSRSEILLIAWAAFWPILLGTITGVASIDTGFRDVGRTLRMNRRQLLLHVRLPAAAPHAFAGINVGISVSVVAMVALELFSATNGLGRYLAFSKIRFDMPGAYAGALAAGCLGFVVATAFFTLERRVFMKWHHQRGDRIDAH